MVTKQKTWFKSAFNEPKVLQSESPRKSQIHDVFRNEADSIDFTDLNFTNTNNESIVSHSNKTLSNVSIIYSDVKSSNWIENFAPRTKSDLVIHAKKISEIEDWFNAMKAKKTQSPSSILLVTGPSGSGKTSTVKIIAKEFGFTISEWITPVDIEYTRHIQNENNNSNVSYCESQNDKFSQFLFQSSRYRSVFDTSTKRLVLIEEFPNAFIKDPSSFEQILEKYSIYGKSPLIFIVTDTKSRALNISYNLFSDETRERFNITTINFNAIADTMLKKGLKRICDIMTQPAFQKYYDNPNKDMIESIVLSSQGDIRSAVINLHFASQRNSSKLLTEVHDTSKTSRSKKTKNTKKSKLKSLGSDESISMLHALGRVFNPKYQDQRDENGNKVLVHSPDEISSLLTSQPSTSFSLIHNNYVSHYQQFDDVVQAADYLSISDVISNEWRSDQSNEIGVNLAVRGVMISNEKPVSGRWMPIKSNKKDIKQKTNYGNELNKLQVSVLVTPSDLACDYQPFSKLILSSNAST